MRRPVRPTFATAAVSAAAVLTVGCYTYTPVDSGRLDPGQPVHVTLTEEGGFRVASAIGPYGTSLDGKVTERDDSSLVMSVTQVTRRTGVEESWRGESVRVPRAAVASVTVQKLSRTKSILMASGVVVAALGLAAALGGASSLGGKRGGGGSNGQ